MVYNKKITKNKSLEIQFDFFNGSVSIFKVYFEINHKCDHSGLHFFIDIWKYSFSFIFYDIRHFDYENNRYIDK